jgi:phage repressor protein C with HTH and peptisase S24 domain
MDARQILKILIKEYGGTQKVFASIIGTTQPAVANWIAANQIPESGIAKICKALPEVSFEWLIGKVETPPRGYQDTNYVASTSPLPMGKPFYSQMPTSAGQLIQGDEDITTERIYIPNQTAEFYFPVHGNSMFPTIDNGDVIGARELKSASLIRPNDIYVIGTRAGERMVKRIKGINGNDPNLTLYSDNPAFEPFNVEKQMIVHVFKVTTIIKKLE